MVFIYRFVFFFNDTATTEIYTLSLHDALPIPAVRGVGRRTTQARPARVAPPPAFRPVTIWTYSVPLAKVTFCWVSKPLSTGWATSAPTVLPNGIGPAFCVAGGGML